MRKNMVKLFAGVLSAVMLLPGIGIIQTRADTQLDRYGALFKSGGTVYYPNYMGGAAAYVPIDFGTDGKNARAVANAMLSLPGMGDGLGKNSEKSAFRYQGFNAYTSKGANAQYLVKTAAHKTEIGNTRKWLNPGISVTGNELLSFRYAGMVISEARSINKNSVKFLAGTNPYFAADVIWPSNNGGVSILAKVYTRSRQGDGILRTSDSTQTVYDMGHTPEPIENMETNGMYGTGYWDTHGNVKTNRATDVNRTEESAEKAFTLWANGDSYGAAYKQEAENYIQRTGSSLKWWQVLNRHFQVIGDPYLQNPTLYFYMVRSTAKHFYSTYTLGGKIDRNISPTLLVIKDEETGAIVSEAYRVVDDMTSTDGVVTVVGGQIAKLVPGRHYTVEGIMTYYTSEKATTNSNRGIRFYARNASAESSPISLDTASMIAYSSLPDASVISNASSVDGKSTGTVSTSKITQATENIEIPDEYYYQGAAFAALNFTIPENLQDMQTGYLVIAVPQSAAESDDNQCTTDDTLEIQYVLTTEVTPDPDPIPQSDAFGDMNLGMPEYRQLHYITEEEEESDDDEDEDSEPEMIDYEVWSDYGYYQTEDQASLVGKTQSSTPESPNNVNIWEANMVSDAKSTPWWDYSNREWPDQVADIENKCWLTDANGAWKQSGEFLRSFSGENIFGFGFRVSRSRGKKNSILNAAKINVQIYGVSPDTTTYCGYPNECTAIEDVAGNCVWKNNQ